MNDLVTWLRAVLADDERTARHLRSALPDVPSERTFSYDFLLADIAAKRAILDAYVSAKAYTDAFPHAESPGIEETETLAHVVRLLASAYRDRPGYREEWRP